MTITTNLLPDLNPWEYDALKESIRRWKVILPVVKDENGDIIDGYQRVRVCNELGITDYPVLTLAGLGDDEKRDHAYVLNLVRRRLSQKQMRELIAAELKRTPDLSDNWLAQILGTTDKTVAAVRQELIATSEIPKLNALRGKDGKYRRVTRIVTNTPKEAERAQQALSQGIPELVEAMDSGRLSISAAAEVAGAEPEVQRAILSRGELESTWAAREIRRERRRIHSRDWSVEIQTPPFGQPWTITSDQAVQPCEAVITDPPFGVTAEQWDRDIERTTRAWASAWNESEAHFICTFFSQRHLFEGRRWLDESLTNYEYVQLLSASYTNYNLRFATPGQFQRNWDVLLLYRRKNSNRLVNPSGARWTNGFAQLAAMTFTFPQSNFNGPDQKVHPFQKSLGCMRWLVQNLTEPGDLVADPFAGSGTTGIAAVQLGRRAHLIEIDATYRDLAEQRLAAFGQATIPTSPPGS